MKYVQVKNLKSGMMITKSIYDENGIKLLGCNKVLTDALISKIENLGYAGVFIYDEYSKYEELEEIIKEEDRIKMVNSLRNFNIDQVIFYANKLVDELLDKQEIQIEFNDLRNYHNSTYEHSVNVAMLAVSCGIGLGLNNSQLSELAVSAMLHDIGKECIPIDILDKPGRLDDNEREMINSHPQFGYDMLKDNVYIASTIRVSVLEHHENYDGTGYPRGLTGNEIFLYARIIHVADVYDALCAKRAYKEDYDPAEAIEYLMSNCGKMFDYDVVRTFLRYIVVYPVGTTVTLSTGEKAHVVKNRSNFVLRPVVVTEDERKIDLAYDTDAMAITIIKD